jgi:hypothetical protein
LFHVVENRMTSGIGLDTPTLKGTIVCVFGEHLTPAGGSALGKTPRSVNCLQIVV